MSSYTTNRLLFKPVPTLSKASEFARNEAGSLRPSHPNAGPWLTLVSSNCETGLSSSKNFVLPLKEIARGIYRQKKQKGEHGRQG
jgi:hypothetical protein